MGPYRLRYSLVKQANLCFDKKRIYDISLFIAIDIANVILMSYVPLGINFKMTFGKVTPTVDVVDTKTNIKTETQAKTNTKCFDDPMYALFLKIGGFKDIKYDI